MAGGGRPTLMLTFFLIALFVITTVNLTKMEVMALREIPQQIAVIKRNMFSLTGACTDHCNKDSDCSESYYCRQCVYGVVFAYGVCL
uniref:Fruit-specific protein-like n=1 Tax=Nicotiana tabacum TaxID=4097 RepID=A0A1S4AES3_TOBAC|nr:fruit-specific protein-like [Nicotiana tomentosiformis]XP_016475124.1 PREDICTED: fruit-specific protein-like [Nicotiana tabacum]